MLIYRRTIKTKNRKICWFLFCQPAFLFPLLYSNLSSVKIKLSRKFRGGGARRWGVGMEEKNSSWWKSNWNSLAIISFLWGICKCGDFASVSGVKYPGQPSFHVAWIRKLKRKISLYESNCIKKVQHQLRIAWMNRICCTNYNIVFNYLHIDNFSTSESEFRKIRLQCQFVVLGKHACGKTFKRFLLCHRCRRLKTARKWTSKEERVRG